MIFISATRLRVKSFIYLFKFMSVNEASVKEIKRIEGFLGGRELVDKNLVFWTLTMWDNDNSMKQFRNSVPHKKAMQKLPYCCCEASYIHWLQEENILPDWKVVEEKMLTEARLTKVRNPSKDQIAKNYPGIKWTKLQRDLK
jgi:hypothetical protein